MKTLADFCTFDFLPWADYSVRDFLVQLDPDDVDRVRVYRPRDRNAEEIWIYLDGGRVAVVKNGTPVTLTRDDLAPWLDQAEADALVAEVRAGFGLM
ncbi:hypothetical protein [Salipiger marinus]|uniref:Uncharacterized protein n=1 Tax=Salipiger marinus TaxID=555512 RepID=A0A1G8LKF4_9RHOB|nr:hypothetical protein [Salipiger marinus]SDI56171.1 hypothetical protein SAMN04487993_1006217 [Salipiger marinus]